jgi:hypothetical protein
MNARSFWRQLWLAILISVIGGVLHMTLSSLFGTPLSIRLTLLVVAFVYVLALLRSSPSRSGRLLAALVWIGLSAGLLAFNPGLSIWVVLQTGFIWLLRSLLRYDSLIAAGADGLISAFAMAAGVATALHTGNLFLCLWSYFLTQALSALVPKGPGIAPAEVPADHDFDASFRNAEAALRRLSLRS